MTDNWIHLYTTGVVKMDARFAVVRDGLTLIHGRGYQEVVIHTDNLQVVKAIQNVHLIDSSSTLLRRIHASLQAIHHWKIKHIPREKNEAADRIAKMVTVKSTDKQVFEDTPEELLPVLEIDR
ncbi:hypothetical protein Golob_007566, partial [Gossypium lobatum]|nr:hypothetical protein [Gossypium lobatum]